MDINKLNNILSNDEKIDIFYNNKLVWIQGISYDNKFAKIGFIDNFEEMNVDISDLHEK